jgi:tRNA U34 2-thiouridine synthase MnmA/TrmU
MRLGAEKIATGRYARVTMNSGAIQSAESRTPTAGSLKIEFSKDGH